jgi:uncharacterized protein
MTLFFGYICALIMGITLGLIGGGGSILTVPILIYLFQIDTVLATGYSLFIVGLTSLVGSFSHIRQKNVDFTTAFVFGVPSIISVFVTRYYLMPMIPKEIMTIGQFILTKDIFLLIIFALLMIVASYSMIRICKNCPEEEDETPQPIEYNYVKILLEGLVVGIVTGLVGAGGGFLIIPALVLFAKLPMKKAVGTSLVIIAMKSLIGFLGDLNKTEAVDWHFLGVFSMVAIVGILLGSYFSRFISNKKLKPAFGYFVLIMGFYILVKEIFL